MRVAAHIVEQARAIRIEDEIARRGITLRGKIDQCGPCPVCGGVDRFSINLKKQVFFCRRCNVGGDIIQLVRLIDACTFIQAVETLTGDHVRPQASPPAPKKKKQNAADYEREQHRKARWLWARRKPITGSIAEPYLREGRKITS